MLRTQLILPCAAAALLALSFTSGAQTPPAPQVDPALVELQGKVDSLTERVEFLETFVSAQAEAGAELASALTRAESEGFTAGINPKSREVLLAGLRAQADAMKKGEGVPSAEGDEGDDPSPAKRRAGRGQRRSK